MNDEFVEKKKKNEGEMNAGLKYFLKNWSDSLHFSFFFSAAFHKHCQKQREEYEKSHYSRITNYTDKFSM